MLLNPLAGGYVEVANPLTGLLVKRVRHNRNRALQFLNGTLGHTPSLEGDRQRSGGQHLLQDI